MNKKLALSVLTLACALFLSVGSYVQAQNTSSFAPVPSGMPAQPFGQTHAYTVTFRGNQEAVVSMKAIVTNYEEATMSAMTFQVPKGVIKSISAYQLIREPQCIQYDYSVDKMAIQNDQRIMVKQEPKCLQYSEPNYYDYYGNTKYMKADVSFNQGEIIVNLSKNIDPQKSGSIVLYYRATGYVTKDSFGAMKYAFETLKTDATIRSLTVGINTDTDLVLEGTNETVNYETTRTIAPSMSADSGIKQGAFMSPEFDSYYQQIGYGRITKSTADLQPFDSFTVEGRYAKSKMQLYGKSIAIGSLIILGVLLVIVLLMYRLVKSFSKKQSPIVAKNAVPVPSSSHSVLMMVGLGFLSSVFAAMYTIFLYVITMMLGRLYYSDMNTVIMLFIALISCVVYILLIFGPAVFIGWKRGVWWGFGAVATTVLFLCMYVGLFVIYIFMVNQQHMYPGPIYMNSATGSSEPAYMK